MSSPVMLASSSLHFYSVVTDSRGSSISGNHLFLNRFKRTGGADSFIASVVQTDIQKFYATFTMVVENPATAVNVYLQHQLIAEEIFTVQWQASLLVNEHNNDVFVQWTGQEINEKQAYLTVNNKAESLNESELFYRELVGHSLDGILLADEKGLMEFASASCKKILGFTAEELVTRSLFEFVHPEDKELAVTSFYNEVKKEPKQRFINIRLLQKDGHWLWCIVRGHNLTSNPTIGKILVYFNDDSLRINAEAALIESKIRFVQLIQNIDMGILLADAQGTILLCNRRSLEIFNVPEEILLGQNLYHADWKAIDENNTIVPIETYPMIVALQTRKPVRNKVIGVKSRAKENIIWLNLNAEPVLNTAGEIENVICSFTDITEQRQLAIQLKEQEIQKQKQLVQASIDGQEKERKEISRELHDNISQTLTTTRLYLEVAKDKADPQSMELIEQAHKNLLIIIQGIRQLTTSLAPPELHDIGLIESIRDICRPLQKIHACKIEFMYQGLIEEKLSDGIKLMLFRIIQEQINNIIRHAKAGLIQIMLVIENNEVKLEIIDNGTGFDTTLIKKGLGLTNIFNRVELFDGRAEIITHPGQGCVLKVKAPLS